MNASFVATPPSPPPPTRKPTPLAIVEAAERLFGSHGIENVSLRQIRLEASAANNSAVSYHFNDREALVRAIWEHRLPVLDRMRAAMIQDLRAAGRERDPHAVLRALVMPNYELRDSRGVHRYAAFFRHAMRWRAGAAIRHSQNAMAPFSAEALDLLEQACPDVPRPLLHQRLRYGSCAFFDMICDRDEDIAASLPVEPEDAFIAEGIAMLVAICVRPITGVDDE